MFPYLVDHRPQVASQARTLRRRMTTAGAMIYEVALRPVPEAQSVYMAMARVIQGHKYRSTTERRHMHEYTMSLLFGDGMMPRGMDPSLASYTEALLFAQRFHYRRLHPFRSRLQAAA